MPHHVFIVLSLFARVCAINNRLHKDTTEKVIMVKTSKNCKRRRND